MNRSQLQSYTKCPSHYGKNQATILNNFMTYASLSYDPFNVFRYMQEKAICTFLPSFWINKANYFADIGDYNNCFQCLSIGRCRIGACEDESDKNIDFDKLQIKLFKKLEQEIKSHPPKFKRSVEEYNLLYGNDKKIDEYPQNRRRLLIKIYNINKSKLSSAKSLQTMKNNSKLEKSWMFYVYQMEDINQKKIEDKIHQNSVNQSRDVAYHSIHTPLKTRDPQRLNKTIDSVEIIKKKRHSLQKIKKSHVQTLNFQDDDLQYMTDLVASVPVGRQFQQLKHRRVTFINGGKTQKIRGSQTESSHRKGIIIRQNRSRSTHNKKSAQKSQK